MRSLAFAIGTNVIGPVLFLTAMTIPWPGDESSVAKQLYAPLTIAAWGFIVAGGLAPLAMVMAPTRLNETKVRLTKIFSPVFIALALAACLLTLSTALWIFLSVHLFFVQIVGATSLVGPIGAALLALIVAIIFAEPIIAYIRSLKPTVCAALVRPGEAPGLEKMTKELAFAISAPAPRAIVIGAQPEIFAINKTLRLVPNGEKISGVTLYVSAALLRLLNKTELRAVIAHELLHLNGKGLVYTKRAGRAYRMLYGLVVALAAHGSVIGRPFLGNFRTLQEAAAPVDRRLNQMRELTTDKVAAKIATPTALISALKKIAILTDPWRTALHHNAQAESQGELIPHIERSLYKHALSACSSAYVSAIAKDLARHRTNHPLDHHPRLKSRAEYVGVPLAAAKISLCNKNKRVASARLREAVADALHAQSIYNYDLTPPDDVNARARHNRDAYRVIYQVTEYFSGGPLDATDRRYAEAVGKKHFPKFNPVLFKMSLHAKRNPIRMIVLAKLTAEAFAGKAVIDLRNFVRELISSEGKPTSAENKDRYRAFFKQVAMFSESPPRPLKSKNQNAGAANKAAPSNQSVLAQKETRLKRAAPLKSLRASPR